MSTKVTDKIFAYSYNPPTNPIGDEFENSLIIVGKEQQIWQPLTNSYVGIGLSRFNSVADSINNIPNLLTSTHIWGQQFSYDSLTGKFNDIQGNIDVQGNISNVYNIIPKTSNNYNIGNSLNYFAEGYITYLKGYTYNVILTNFKSNSFLQPLTQNDKNKMYMIFGLPNGKLCYCPEFKITNLGTSDSNNVILLSRSSNSIGLNTLNTYIPILYADGNTYVNGNSYINGTSYAQTTYTIQSSHANKFIKHGGTNIQILLANGEVFDRSNLVEYATAYWANMRLSETANTSATPQFRSVSLNCAMDSDSYTLKVNGTSYLNGKLTVANNLDVNAINANGSVTTSQKFISTNGGLQIANLANSENYILKADGTYVLLSSINNDDHKVEIKSFNSGSNATAYLMLTGSNPNDLSYGYILQNKLQYDTQAGILEVQDGVRILSIDNNRSTYLLNADGGITFNDFLHTPSTAIGSKYQGAYWNGSSFAACQYATYAYTYAGTKYHLTYYKENNTIAAYETTIGSTTKGMYLNAGVPTVMTYELKSHVNTGQTDHFAFYTNDNIIGTYTGSAGSATKGIYFNNGVPTIMTYELKSNVNTGQASRLSFYTSKDTITNTSISTDGNYLANINYLTINGNNQTNYRLKVTGKSYVEGSSYVSENIVATGYAYANSFIKKGGTGNNVLLDNGTTKAIDTFNGDHKVEIKSFNGGSNATAYLMLTGSNPNDLSYGYILQNKLQYDTVSGILEVQDGVRILSANNSSYLLTTDGTYAYIKSGNGISISKSNNNIEISTDENYEKITVTTTLTIETNWKDAYTFNNTFTTGLYSALLYSTTCGYYSGTMTINPNLSGNYTDEIMLHGGNGTNRLYLRTIGNKLQIACETNSISNTSCTFTFKKII